MSHPIISFPSGQLVLSGLQAISSIRYQLTPQELTHDALEKGEGLLNDSGALVIQTGSFTGRSPKDKFIVNDAVTSGAIDWNDVNIPIEEKYFNIIYNKVMAYLDALPEFWVRDCYACADPRYRINLRVVNEQASGNLFACNMFLQPTAEEQGTVKPEWHIIAVPGLLLDAATCGTRQQNAVVISFTHKTILIAGTGYTGEIKEGFFTVLNYILPHEKNVLSMHCAANMGGDGNTAVFFGLSGTGKTTLSADPARKLIGDDEHGWSDTGVFNFEGGCYAKTIGLEEKKEPGIFHAIRPGALVENVVFFAGTDKINFDDGAVTENARVSYPLSFNGNAIQPSVGKIPENVFFLTSDASGVLPPISRLTPGQAMYQFISGYTAKIAGTETGIIKPELTFSACFGAPFLPLHPGRYAQMLGDKIKAHNVKIWLVNTGWTGGPYGTGSRIKLACTRAMITAALDGAFDHTDYVTHPVFGFTMPVSCPGVPAELLIPRNTWKDKNAYDAAAAQLAALFIQNFEKYAESANEETLAAAPKV